MPAGIVGEPHPPESVAPIDPRYGSIPDPKAVGTDMTERFRIKNFNRSRHRLLREVGVRAVQLPFDNAPAVQVFESFRRPIPAGNFRSVRFTVFGNGTVVDDRAMVLVDRDALLG